MDSSFSSYLTNGDMTQRYLIHSTALVYCMIAVQKHFLITSNTKVNHVSHSKNKQLY